MLENLSPVTDASSPALPAVARAAVILNANAKRVTPRVRKQVLEAAPDADVFFTESLEQANFLLQRVVELGYSTVLTGGGDGTVASTIGRVVDYADAMDRPVPRFGILRLGTGNGVADFVGARDFRKDLAELEIASEKPLGLLRVNGSCCTFAGFGWDAHILDSYQRMKSVAAKIPVARKLFQTAAGYMIAAFGKSVPQLLVTRPRWKVRIYNTGGLGFKVNADGEVIERILPGAVAYEGCARICTFGTTPYYGYKFMMMPFAARLPGMFHTRIVDFNPLYAVGHLPSIWRRGYVNHPGCTDLLLSSSRIEVCEGEVPLQIAGDASGYHSTIEVRYDRPVQCLTYEG